MQKPFTIQLREIMRNHRCRGSIIWTNRYSKSRSVKCYSTGDDGADRRMMIQLAACCRENNINAEVYSQSVQGWGSGPLSIIVRWKHGE